MIKNAGENGAKAGHQDGVTPKMPGCGAEPKSEGE
jgi:hypothetical protein